LRLGHVTGTFQAVEDQVEPELELATVVVAGLQDMLDGQLGEVGVFVGGEPRHDRPRQVRGLLPALERQARLLQREPVDVTVQDRERVRGQRDREAGSPQASEHRVVVPQRGRTGRATRLHQADRPPMAAEDLTGADRPLAHGRLPVGFDRRQADLAEHQVDHAVEQVALAGHVVVQRHRLDPEDVPAIDRTYPLAETPAAIRHVQEGRARGKVVITI